MEPPALPATIRQGSAPNLGVCTVSHLGVCTGKTARNHRVLWKCQPKALSGHRARFTSGGRRRGGCQTSVRALRGILDELRHGVLLDALE